MKKLEEENKSQKKESIELKTALTESQKASEKAKMESVRLSQMLAGLRIKYKSRRPYWRESINP